MFQSALEVPLEVAVDTDILNPRTGGLIGAFDKNEHMLAHVCKAAAGEGRGPASSRAGN